MAQTPIPDGDSTGWIVGAIGALTTIVGTISGAYVAIRRVKSDTQTTAATTAQTTVQSSLEAMRSVVVDLTKELERKQEEIDELRRDMREVRDTNLKLERENAQYGIQLDRVTEVAKQQGRRIAELEQMLGIRHTDGGTVQIRDLPKPEIRGLDDAG